MTKKYKATEEQFRRALLKWLNRQRDQLRANVHGDDDTSEWCKDEADLVEQHIQTVESLIFVNEALKLSTDEANQQADLAYDRIEELEVKLAKAVEERDEALNQLDSTRHSVSVLEKRIAELNSDAR